MLVPSMMNVNVSFTVASISNGPGVYDRTTAGPPCGSVLSKETVLPLTAVTWQISSKVYGGSSG